MSKASWNLVKLLLHVLLYSSKFTFPSISQESIQNIALDQWSGPKKVLYKIQFLCVFEITKTSLYRQILDRIHRTRSN